MRKPTEHPPNVQRTSSRTMTKEQPRLSSSEQIELFERTIKELEVLRDTCTETIDGLHQVISNVKRLSSTTSG